LGASEYNSFRLFQDTKPKKVRRCCRGPCAISCSLIPDQGCHKNREGKIAAKISIGSKPADEDWGRFKHSCFSGPFLCDCDTPFFRMAPKGEGNTVARHSYLLRNQFGPCEVSQNVPATIELWMEANGIFLNKHHQSLADHNPGGFFLVSGGFQRSGLQAFGRQAVTRNIIKK